MPKPRRQSPLSRTSRAPNARRRRGDDATGIRAAMRIGRSAELRRSIGGLGLAARAAIVGQLQRSAGNAAVQRLILQRDIYHENQPDLVWKDFKGKAPKGSPFAAATYSGIAPFGLKMKYSWKQVPGGVEAEGEYDVSKLNLKAFMRPGKSWVRKAKKSAALLRHEDGHFDISHVIAEKGEPLVAAAAAGVKFSETRPTKAKAIKAIQDALNTGPPLQKLNDTNAVLNSAQTDYDDDPVKGTNHGLKAAEQAQWEADIVANLPAYPVP